MIYKIFVVVERKNGDYTHRSTAITSKVIEFAYREVADQAAAKLEKLEGATVVKLYD